MIIEFAVGLTLSLPNAGPSVTQVEFQTPVQEVITYPEVGVVEQVMDLSVPLPGGTSEAFEQDFKNGSVFFGAFALSKDFSYGYVTGANSPEAAREIALEECRKQAPTCSIFATILPQGYTPLQPGQVSLAPEAAGYFNNPDPSWGNHRAMAISEDGAYSVVWNYESPSAAVEAAMNDCSGYTINDLPGLRDMPCILLPFK
ncbi:MAG: hypothetical protein AAGL89_10540 [Pseudomonadota bacterium]